MSSEPVRSSAARKPRVGDVFRYVGDWVVFRVTKTEDTQYPDAVDCEAVDRPGEFRWTSLRDWNEGRCHIIESGPAPAESAKCESWCGRKYGHPDVPGVIEGTCRRPFGVAELQTKEELRAQPAYCTQACADRSAKPAKVASEAVAFCNPGCTNGDCEHCREWFGIGEPPKPAPQPVACTWVCSGDIHGPRCPKFVSVADEAGQRAAELHVAKYGAIVGYYSDDCLGRTEAFVPGYAEWSVLQRGLEPDGAKVKAPRIRDIFLNGDATDPEWVAGQEAR